VVVVYEDGKLLMKWTWKERVSASGWERACFRFNDLIISTTRDISSDRQPCSVFFLISITNLIFRALVFSSCWHYYPTQDTINRLAYQRSTPWQEQLNIKVKELPWKLPSKLETSFLWPTRKTFIVQSFGCTEDNCTAKQIARYPQRILRGALLSLYQRTRKKQLRAKLS